MIDYRLSGHFSRRYQGHSHKLSRVAETGVNCSVNYSVRFPPYVAWKCHRRSTNKHEYGLNLFHCGHVSNRKCVALLYPSRSRCHLIFICFPPPPTVQRFLPRLVLRHFPWFVVMMLTFRVVPGNLKNLRSRGSAAW